MRVLRPHSHAPGEIRLPLFTYDAPQPSISAEGRHALGPSILDTRTPSDDPPTEGRSWRPKDHTRGQRLTHLSPRGSLGLYELSYRMVASVETLGGWTDERPAGRHPSGALVVAEGGDVRPGNDATPSRRRVHLQDPGYDMCKIGTTIRGAVHARMMECGLPQTTTVSG